MKVKEMRVSMWILLMAFVVGCTLLYNLFFLPPKTNSNRPEKMMEKVAISPFKLKPKIHFNSHTELITEASNKTLYFDHESFKELSDILLTVRDPDQFLTQKNMSKNGFHIIDRLDRLGTLRIKISNPSVFTQFLAENSNNLEIQKNVRLKIPAIPEQRFLELEEPFNGTSMDWLGTQKDRKNSGAGIKIAVLDTGIDSRHESLSGLNFTEISLVEEEKQFRRGHGTGIVSIIAGQSQEFLGLAPSSEILSVKVLRQDGEGDSFTIAKGIMMAVDQGADIINLSLGGTSSSVAIDHAIEYASANDVLLVSAVGNEGVNQVSYPARHKKVIAVSSIDAKARVSAFANYGPEVDLAAPGVGVFTAWDDQAFVKFSGTSISAAFVTGALAHELSKSAFQNKMGSLEALYANTDETEKPGRDVWSGRGVLNLRRLDQRNTPGIVDAALIGYYFDPNNLSSSGTTPFQVTVQNQGTEWIQSLNLKVKYKGLEKDFRLGNLNTGETRSETLYFDSGTPEKGLSISSELRVLGVADQYPENNVRKSRLLLP